MDRKGSAFAGLSVAIVTPFRDGQIDFEDASVPSGFPSRGGDDLHLSRRHHGGISHAFARRARAGDLRSGPACRGADQGHGRHRIQQHGGSDPLDDLGGSRGGGCGAAGRTVLQQADSARFLRALFADFRSGRDPAVHLQHPWPDREEHRTGNDLPPWRTGECHDGQGGYRLAGSGLADPGRQPADAAQRRRQPDPCR
jgi:hypothetical protein